MLITVTGCFRKRHNFHFHHMFLVTVSVCYCYCCYCYHSTTVSLYATGRLREPVSGCQQAAQHFYGFTELAS
jgi:hypothetical protein